MVSRGKIITLPTKTISPENTPVKKKSETLIAYPTWKYVGPADIIDFEWQIGEMNSTFNGITESRKGSASQPASQELAPFSGQLPAISLSPLSPGYYDCEIWFRNKFDDLRVIVKNCVRISEEAVQHTLSISMSPYGAGYVTKSPDQQTYPHESIVTLTAVPASGYQFERWSGSISSTRNPVQIQLNANASITAVFKVAAQYTLSTSVSPYGAGSVSKNPNQSAYEPGTLVTVTAVPASGYYFDHWGGDASGSSSSIGVRMDGKRSVIAYFKEQEPEPGGLIVTFDNDPTSGGYITPEPWLVEYQKYDQVTCTGRGNVGWTLDHWTVNGKTYTGWKIYITITEDTEVIAHWRLK